MTELRSEARGTSVIVNVLDVLRCFTVERPLIGVTEIAEQVGLHKSSISRILSTLEQERVVERDEQTRKYRLGVGLIAIAGPLLANLDVRQVAYPILQELRDSTSETAVLNIWDGSESISVEQIPSNRLVKHTSVMGSRYRSALSASVQIFLAHEIPERCAQLLASGEIELSGLSVEEYCARLELVRERGYAVNYGETSREEVAVAAEILDHRSEVVACAMIAAPFYRVGSSELEELSSAAVTAARKISQRLGYQSNNR
ncbi:IclR family transcriptional regulator [Glutamicibacter halophytocola]|uniref:IclR family transcriptional regulator n=1 Tax=Glutamicibacter halophytocola TaxID=1933880 RepID=A0ABX5Y9A6_9MICC|nr:IclR family transcriptional regulator [Glutamicibacter halophytocola]QDY66250.1 IclR family transcriptional regulator [Glutamicibacter halophytocola]